MFHINWSHAFIALLLCVVINTTAPSLADNYSEAEKRILQKEQELETVDWLKKKQSEHQEILNRTSNISTIALEKENIVPAYREEKIGLLNLTNGGFNSTIWRSYDREKLEEDFSKIITLFNETGLYPSQREIIQALLVTQSPAPRGFSDEDFLIFRINTLLSLGMREAALDLYKAFTQRNIIDDNSAIINIGIKALIHNNEYSSVCLLINITDADKTVIAPYEESCKALKTDQALNPLEFLKHFAFPNKKTNDIVLTKDTELKSASLQKAFLMEQKTPLSLRKRIFTNLISLYMLSPKDLDILYKENPVFIKLAKQDLLPQIERAKSTLEKLNLIEKQVIKNGNPANPISKFYESYLNKIKPNEKYIGFSIFLYRFFALNGYETKANAWSELSKEESEKFKINDLEKKYEKKSSFFIFPLAHYKNFMLKINTTLDNNMEKHYITDVKKSVVKSFEHQCILTTRTQKKQEKACPRIETLNLKTFNPETSNMLRRFSKAIENSNDIHNIKAETVTLSVLLWDNMINKSHKTDDLEKKANFILHSLSKSDLNYYVFAFSRDFTSDSIY